MKMNKTLFLIFAHPDDEVLGCGGTVARLVREGYKAYTLILGEGITSRDKSRNKDERLRELEELKDFATKANEILGVEGVFFGDFPDNRFDSVPLLDIIKKVEEVIEKIKPSVIFTHYEKDLNIDHQITYRAVITATRPMKGCPVKEIYSCEVLSSTEWNYPISFSPDVFFDISQTIEVKLKALKEYKGELRDFPHPRSLEAVKLNAKMWGVKTCLEYAEAFKCVRLIR